MAKRSTRRPLSGSQVARFATKEFVQDWQRDTAVLKQRLSIRPVGADDRAPQDKRFGILKTAAYTLVRERQYNRRVMLNLERHTEYLSESNHSTTFTENPYFWVLSALNSELKLGLSIQSISKFSKELRYAEIHHVEPEFLVGFIYQVGTKETIAQKLREGKTELWLKPLLDRRELKGTG